MEIQSNYQATVMNDITVKSARCTHWVCSGALVLPAGSHSAASLDSHNTSTCTACSGLLRFSSCWPAKHGVLLSAPRHSVVALTAGTREQLENGPSGHVPSHCSTAWLRDHHHHRRRQEAVGLLSCRAPETPSCGHDDINMLGRCAKKRTHFKTALLRSVCESLIQCSRSALY